MWRIRREKEERGCLLYWYSSTFGVQPSRSAYGSVALYIGFHRTIVPLDDINRAEGHSKHLDAMDREHSPGKPDGVREKLRCLDDFDEDIKSLFTATKRESPISTKDLDKEDRPAKTPGAYSIEATKSHLKCMLWIGPSLPHSGC